MDDLDRVAGADLALGQDAEVGAGPAGGREAARELLAADADPQLVAGGAGAVTSSRVPPARQRSPTTAPLTSIPRTVRLSRRSRDQLAAELAAPPLVVLDGVGVQRLVDPAVDLGVALGVAVHVGRPHRTRPGTGSFQIAVRTTCPRQLTSLGVPTFTDSTTPATPASSVTAVG